RREALVEAISRYTPDGSDVLELGCGWGLNLFSLYMERRWPRLAGYDISWNALMAAREAAQHFGIPIEFDVVDAIDGEASGFAAFRGHTVFTYYALEQLKYETRKVIANVARWGPRRVIHIEPSSEYLRWLSPLDVINRLYIARRDYQDNLLRT